MMTSPRRLSAYSSNHRARALWFEEYADSRLGDVIIWDYFYQKVVHPLVWGEPGDAKRIERAEAEAIPAECDFLEREVPGDGFLFGDIGLADFAVASFFRNAEYAGFSPDPERWPKLAAYVERVLAHPAIDQAAVVGLPHEHWGEQVVAFVVVRDGMNVSDDDLKVACRERLSRYKVPKEFRLVQDLPRNRMGKIDRRGLREQDRKDKS